MISAADLKRFDELRAKTKCSKKYSCLYANLDDLCKGKYHADIDIFECLEDSATACEFVRPFGCTVVCTCPLRKFIAQHFGDWTAEETSLLRPEAN